MCVLRGLRGKRAASAVHAFDCDPETFWHTEWVGEFEYTGKRLKSLSDGEDAPSPPRPHEIKIDLGSVVKTEGLA